MEKVSIKNFQEELKLENDKKIIYSLDFNGELWLIVSKDNIYVKNWNPTCPDIPQFEFWNEEYMDNYDECKYLHFEDYEYEDLKNIVEDMKRECKYNTRKFGE